MNTFISIVVPCYNEEAVLETTQQRLKSVCDSLMKENLIEDYELLFINDGSRDRTGELLSQYGQENPRIKSIQLSNNFGHQAALTAGLNHAKGDMVVSIDADLQDPPSVIIDMVKKFHEGYDIIYGVRNDRESDSFFKKWTAQGFYTLMQKMDVRLIYNHADFRLISKQVLNSFLLYNEVHRFIRGMFPLMGYKHTSVEYAREERFAGESKYPFRKMLAFAFDGITSFSTLPLKFAMFLGSIVCLASLLLTAWALYSKLQGNIIPGWTSTVIPIYFLGGVQLLILGVLGEYIGKIYMQSKNRPLYIIKKTENI